MEVSKKIINPLVVGVIAVASLGIGLYGGAWYQKQKIKNNFPDRFRHNCPMMRPNGQKIMNRRDGCGQNFGKGMMGFGGAITGEVTASDEKTITIKLSDGSSKIVVVGSDTKYTESNQVSKEKISVGTKVAVFGSLQNDGTISANSIEINPPLRGQQ